MRRIRDEKQRMRLSYYYVGAIGICATAIRIVGLGPFGHGITQVLTKLKECKQ